MINRCRHCKGSKFAVTTDTKTGFIQKDKCIYCNGKGWIRLNNEKEVNKDGILEPKT